MFKRRPNRDTKRNNRERSRLQFAGYESLEDRRLLAGGLNASVNGSVVLLDLNGESVEIQADRSADAQNLAAFFSANNGDAQPISIQGQLFAGGHAVSGSFALTETSATGGIVITAANASVSLGDPTTGVDLTNADGAFVIVSSGVAGVLSAEDASDGDGLAVYGRPGLRFDSAAGLRYELNTTELEVDVTIPTPIGDVPILYESQDEVIQFAGPSEFWVDGPDGPALRVAGVFTLTEVDGGEGLDIAGEQVGVDVFAGGLRALTLGSAAAEFTLNGEGFNLVKDSFTVGDFRLSPLGRLLDPGEGTFGDDAIVVPVAPLGPMVIEEISLVLPELSFGPAGLRISTGLAAASATLTFPQTAEEPAEEPPEESTAPITLVATVLTGTFVLAGDTDPLGGGVSEFTASGAYSIGAESLEFTVPELLTAMAEDLTISFDPQADSGQELIKAESLMVEVPAVGLIGEIESSDGLPTNDPEHNPALLIRDDGFAFGVATLTVPGPFVIGPPDTAESPVTVTVVDPFVTLTDFSYSDAGGLEVGSLGVGAAEITVEPTNDTFFARGTELVAEITFDDAGRLDNLTFEAGELIAEFGPPDAHLVEITASGVEFTPTVAGSDDPDDPPLLAAESAQATITVGEFTATGAAGAFSIAGDGSIQGPETLFVSLNFTADEDSASKLNLPSFLPLKSLEGSLEWNDFANQPERFLIGVSAEVEGEIGTITVAGGVDRLVIDPFLLAEGKQPVIALDGFSVGASGPLFGGEVSATLIAGVVRLDVEGNILETGEAEADPDEVADSIFYAGIEGSFSFATIGGLGIRLGFSEQGLLQAYFQTFASSTPGVPAGILLDPNTGLALKDFRGGVTFNATDFPKVKVPSDLADPIFAPVATLSAQEWREQLRQTVANQALGGSRLFVQRDDEETEDIDELTAAIDELNERDGELLFDGVLATAFADNDYIVAEEDDPDPQPGHIQKLNGDGEDDDVTLWLVTYKGASYVVELKSNLTGDEFLDVSEALFTDDTSLQGELENNDGQVSQAIVDLFVAQGINLTTEATVEDISTDSATKWKIIDGTGDDQRTYFATVRGSIVAVTGGAGTFNDMENILRIEAGATLFSRNLSEEVFTADVDIIITTDGKFVINSVATVAQEVTFDLRLFGDVAPLADPENIDPLRLVMLANFPSQTSDLPPVAEIGGEATFEYLDENGDPVNLISGDPIAPSASTSKALGKPWSRTPPSCCSVSKMIPKPTRMSMRRRRWT